MSAAAPCGAASEQSAECRNQDRGLEAKVLELVLSERCVPFEKELVELRRLDSGAGEHGVRLPAVVDLVDEQVREHRVNRLAVKAMLSTIEGTTSSSASSVKPSQ